jgi:hypothetical protein
VQLKIQSLLLTPLTHQHILRVVLPFSGVRLALVEILKSQLHM